jgi:hypothetical protein
LLELFLLLNFWAHNIVIFAEFAPFGFLALHLALNKSLFGSVLGAEIDARSSSKLSASGVHPLLATARPLPAEWWQRSLRLHGALAATKGPSIFFPILSKDSLAGLVRLPWGMLRAAEATKPRRAPLLEMQFQSRSRVLVSGLFYQKLVVQIWEFYGRR